MEHINEEVKRINFELDEPFLIHLIKELHRYDPGMTLVKVSRGYGRFSINFKRGKRLNRTVWGGWECPEIDELFKESWPENPLDFDNWVGWKNLPWCIRRFGIVWMWLWWIAGDPSIDPDILHPWTNLNSFQFDKWLREDLGFTGKVNSEPPEWKDD